MAAILAVLVIANGADAAPARAGATGRVTFHGAVIQGQAGGVTGVDVPASQRRTTAHFGVSIRVVDSCSVTATRTISATCTRGAVTPRINVVPGGSDVEITTVYF